MGSNLIASGLDLRLLLFHAGECEQNNASKAPGDTELCVQTDSPPTNENQSYRHIGGAPDEKCKGANDFTGMPIHSQSHSD